MQLRPAYWASVSGGKDSLYMLKLILSNPHEYPLDGVVYFDLETDFPFVKSVINYMESECKKYNITFLRIKPRRTWVELYENTAILVEMLAGVTIYTNSTARNSSTRWN